MQPAVIGGGARWVAINERDQTPDAIHSGLQARTPLGASGHLGPRRNPLHHAMGCSQTRGRRSTRTRNRRGSSPRRRRCRCGAGLRRGSSSRPGLCNRDRRRDLLTGLRNRHLIRSIGAGDLPGDPKIVRHLIRLQRQKLSVRRLKASIIRPHDLRSRRVANNPIVRFQRSLRDQVIRTLRSKIVHGRRCSNYNDRLWRCLDRSRCRFHGSRLRLGSCLFRRLMAGSKSQQADSNSPKERFSGVHDKKRVEKNRDLRRPPIRQRGRIMT